MLWYITRVFQIRYEDAYQSVLWNERAENGITLSAMFLPVLLLLRVHVMQNLISTNYSESCIANGIIVSYDYLTHVLMSSVIGDCVTTFRGDCVPFFPTIRINLQDVMSLKTDTFFVNTVTVPCIQRICSD
jgi:hypothetical protein